ncbi:hypothetical protein [Pedobacter soli]|uniref:Uncharacterized protein n=1 Tax=Pedobacter soli TaxID=390242 RepID=A0A1G6KC87_9SPHI|nr:hypothetical protein [Pedobacter soli]SDC28692.1 hypothetical protein SAMN04488024_101736 [Pedobacter soli]
MKKIDLYKGYEGYSEIVLYEQAVNKKNEITIFEVHLLEFHFDEILSLIPLGQYHEQSVMYNYFRAEGWHNDRWECKRIQEFYTQLCQINISLESSYIDAYSALKEICRSTLDNGRRLFIASQ